MLVAFGIADTFGLIQSLQSLLVFLYHMRAILFYLSISVRSQNFYSLFQCVLWSFIGISVCNFELYCIFPCFAICEQPCDVKISIIVFYAFSGVLSVSMLNYMEFSYFLKDNTLCNVRISISKLMRFKEFYRCACFQCDLFSFIVLSLASYMKKKCVPYVTYYNF